jgi:hypothetical protein
MGNLCLFCGHFRPLLFCFVFLVTWDTTVHQRKILHVTWAEKEKEKAFVRRKNEVRGRKIRERLLQARESLVSRSLVELKLEKERWDIY